MEKLYALLQNSTFWLLLGLGVVGLLLLYHGYRKIKLAALENVSYNRTFSEEGLFVGETMEMVETIRNPGWLPLFRVKLTFYLPAGITVDDKPLKEYTEMTSLFNIPPFGVVTKRHLLRADKRGRFVLGSASIHYFGCEFEFEQSPVFYAYPAAKGLASGGDLPIYRAGNLLASRKYIEDPFFPVGIREYRPGDPMRSINFKASARSFHGGMAQLMCNEYDSSRTVDSMIFLDLNEYPGASVDDKALLETGLAYACYLFCRGAANEGKVGFCANCSPGDNPYVYIPCGRGEEHSLKVLRTMAELDVYAKRDYSMPVILSRYGQDTPTDVDIYLITTGTDEKMNDLLYALKRSGRNVQVILVEEAL